jgi:RNA polymerase primary sigma factor
VLHDGRDPAAARPVAPLNSCEELTDEWDYTDASANIPATIVPDDPLVARCLDDLIDDFQRKGGRLAYDDVTRMSTKRKLSGHQLASLLQGLAQTGVAVSGLSTSPGDLPDNGPGRDIPSDVTPADRDILGRYLAEIGRHPLIWAEDEVRLGRLIKTGQDADAALSESQPGSLKPTVEEQLMRASEAGRRAHDELVLANLRLVVSVARQRRYASSGVELIDRIQDGNLGLMRAADKFDYSLGYKFSTYAMWWIRQSIERGIADKGGIIRLPVHVHERVLKVVRAQRRLTDRYEREPTLDELANATDLAPGAVKAILDWAKPVESLDRVLVHDGDLTYGDLLGDAADIDGRGDPVEVVLRAACVRDLQENLGGLLDSRSALIIARRFGLGTDTDGETLDAIGHDLCVTRERVRQLEAKALETLTAGAVQGGLYEYLIADTRQSVATPPADWIPPGRKKGKKATVAANGGRDQVKDDPGNTDTELANDRRPRNPGIRRRVRPVRRMA